MSDESGTHHSSLVTHHSSLVSRRPIILGIHHEEQHTSLIRHHIAMTRAFARAVEVALAEIDGADAATAADHVRLLVAVVIVSREARAGIEGDEDRRRTAFFIDGERLDLHARKRTRHPAAFFRANGVAVLRDSADDVDDAAAQLPRRRDRLDRLGDDGVEQLDFFSAQNFAHFTPCPPPCSRRAVFPPRIIRRNSPSPNRYPPPTLCRLSPPKYSSSTRPAGVAPLLSTVP